MHLHWQPGSFLCSHISWYCGTATMLLPFDRDIDVEANLSSGDSTTFQVLVGTVRSTSERYGGDILFLCVLLGRCRYAVSFKEDANQNDRPSGRSRPRWMLQASIGLRRSLRSRSSVRCCIISSKLATHTLDQWSRLKAGDVIRRDNYSL
jgi:hypothetical protein